MLQTVLYEIYPHAVVPGGEDSKTKPWMVDYGRVTPLLVKAIQDLSDLNDQKDAEIKELRDQLNEIQQCVESLCNAPHQNTMTNAQPSESHHTLFQNQPNPFNQSTVIRYALTENATSGLIVIRNLNGNQIKAFEISQSGKGQVTVSANELAAGTYTYTLVVGGESVDTKLMVVTK